jgi:Ala-tRNA(Pro) deacylase
MSMTIERYLAQHEIPYELMTHSHSATSMQSARAARVDPHRVAKAVLLEGGDGCYMAAVIPANRQVSLGHLRHDYGQMFRLADERVIAPIFKDCEPGAIPALTTPYHLEMIWDDSLLNEPEIYFEAGDHEHLVHLRTEYLREMLDRLPHGRICEPLG